MDSYQTLKNHLVVFYFSFLCFNVHIVESDVPECSGVTCMNNGTLKLNNNQCGCECADGYAGIRCEYEMEESKWPPGPYAILMPTDGCPENTKSGWRMGYFNFTAKFRIFPRSHGDGNDSTTLNIQEVFGLNVLGPFGPFGLQINFCYKLGDHTLNSVNGWPGNGYGIFGTEAGCPTGFSDKDLDLTLPELSHWNKDGYLPQMTVDTLDNSSGLVQFRLCRKDTQSNDVITEWDWPFILLKNEDKECPDMQKLTVVEENLPFLTNNKTNTKTGYNGVTYCYYSPSNWSDTKVLYQGANGLENLSLGRTVSQSTTHGPTWEADRSVDGYTGDNSVWSKTCSKTKSQVNPWWMVDLASIHYVEKVVIHHRITYSVINVYLSMGVAPGALIDYGHVNGTTDNNTDLFRLHTTAPVRFVKLHTRDEATETHLSMCEVEVYGYKRNTGEYDVGDELAIVGVRTILPERFVEIFKNVVLTSLRRDLGSLPSKFPHMRDMPIAVLEQSEDMPWIVFDVGRVMEVSAVKTFLELAYTAVFSPDDFPQIYISTNKWSFLNHGAEACHYNTYTDFYENVLHKFIRTKNGRYVSLVGKDYQTHEKVLEYFLRLINVRIYVADDSRATTCYEELGMADGSIEDFQLDASSWQSDYPPKYARQMADGWCALEANQDPEPYLQVDLLTVTQVDGITVYNWHSMTTGTIQNRYFKTIHVMGTRSFHLRYGLSRDVLQSYQNKQEFQVDRTGSYADPQMFHFLRPFLARFVRLYPHGFGEDGYPCMKIEIYGCRKTGFPSLNCVNKSTELLPTSRTFVTLKVPVVMKTISTPAECSLHCLHNKTTTCSTIVYGPGTLCSIYISDDTYNYLLISRQDESTYISTALCWNGAREVGPVLLSSTQTVLPESTSLYVYDAGIITSFGYPFHYDTDQIVQWNITFDNRTFIRLLFSNISLHVYDELDNSSDCDDYIALSSHNGSLSRVTSRASNQLAAFELYMNSRYNDRTPTFGTDLSRLLLTFRTCSRNVNRVYTGNGFRVILKKDDLPTCTTLSDERSYVCEKPSMRIVSDSFSGIPYLKSVTETWTIGKHSKRIIHLIVTDFDVGCNEGIIMINAGTHFEVSMWNGGWTTDSYCNTNPPPTDGIYSIHEGMVIHFYYNVQSQRVRLEGFRATYRTVAKNTSLLDIATSVIVRKSKPPHFESDVESLEVCSNSLEKCYYVYPSLMSDPDWFTANSICSSIHGNLVTIHGHLEMMFLKLVLENFTNYESEKDDRFLTWEADPKFYAHIGLSLYPGEDGRIREQWEDGRAVTYTAWKRGQPDEPTERRCTRMGFNQPDDDNTWTSEDCTAVGLGSAGYFICEQRMGITNRSALPRNQTGTSSLSEEETSFYHCGSEEWITVLALCDGISDCQDESDEIKCERVNLESTTCPEGRFRCNNGRCLHMSEVCNSKPDCTGGEDEYCDQSVYLPCDSAYPSAFQCNNGQCVPKSLKCDAFPDCFDGSDEEYCDHCNEKTSYRCSKKPQRRNCVPLSHVCDHVGDCEGEEDELLCNKDSYSSCEEWWKSGYRTNGLYVIDGQPIECNFDRLLSNNSITAVIRGIDMNGVEDKFVKTQFQNLQTARNIVRRNGYTCTQNIVQTCNPDMLEVASYDGIYFNRSNTPCVCVSKYIQFDQNSSSDHYCSEVLSIDLPSSPSDISLIDFADDITFFTFVLPAIYDPRLRFIMSPITCSYEYSVNDLTIPCGGGIVVPSDRHCLYDVDIFGRIDGCWSLNHLQECEAFQCPVDYFKCPESFCISSRLVCDGHKHCKGGEDEVGCWCHEYNNDVIIVRHSPVDKDVPSYIDLLARQLNSKQGSIVLVDYSIPTPVYTLEAVVQEEELSTASELRITDNLFDTFKEQSTKTFLGEVVIGIRQVFDRIIHRFPDKPSKKAIIFIQDDDVSRNVMDLLYSTRHPRLKNGINDGIYIYDVIQDSSMSQVSIGKIDDLVKEIRIRDLNRLGTIGLTFFPELCDEMSNTTCINGYRCMSTKVCIPLKQVCDGRRQCLYSDDEVLCNFTCPEKCSCFGYSVNCKDSNFQYSDFGNISARSRELDLSMNQAILEENLSIDVDLPRLIKLNMSMCDLSALSKDTFGHMANLYILDISFNKIKVLASTTFSVLASLKYLILKGNAEMMTLEKGTFDGLGSLRFLTITDTTIGQLETENFAGLNLTTLDLSNNDILHIDSFAFRELHTETIDLQQSRVLKFKFTMFNGVGSVKSLKTPAHKFCCIRPSYVEEEDCWPYKDEFSSCTSLLRNTTQQNIVWAIGLVAVLTNFLSIFYRSKYNRSSLNEGYVIFTINLAVADLLMGIYVMIIAIAEVAYLGSYIWDDDNWRRSGWCKLAGILSFLSSEASLVFIALLTLDRIFIFNLPVTQFRFENKSSLIISAVTWAILSLLSIIPFTDTDYFHDMFYSRSGVCLALPLSRDRTHGWMYSVTIFVIFNFTTTAAIAIAQGWICKEVVKSLGSEADSSSILTQKELTKTRRLLFVAASNCICWLFITCIEYISVGGVEIPDELHSWTAVLVFTIHSALNPFLHTLVLGKLPAGDWVLKEDKTIEIEDNSIDDEDSLTEKSEAIREKLE